MTQAEPMSVRLHALWLRRRPTLIEDVEQLCSLVDGWRCSRGDLTTVRAAEDEAHRLVGVLGVFGRRDAASLAARLEQELAEAIDDQDVAPDAARGDATFALASAIRANLREDAA